MLNGPSNTWVCAAEPGQAVSDALGAVTFLCHIFWSKKVTWSRKSYLGSRPLQILQRDRGLKRTFMMGENLGSDPLAVCWMLDVIGDVFEI